MYEPHVTFSNFFCHHDKQGLNHKKDIMMPLRSNRTRNYPMTGYYCTFIKTLLLFFVLGIQCNHAQETPTIDRHFEGYQREDVPGIAVSVTKNGETLYEKGFGMANLEYGIPINTKTKFHVASLSKQFTAFYGRPHN